MMQCNVLVFAQLADELDCHSLTIELPENARVFDAIERLACEHAIIAALRENLAIAVNEKYATPETPLTDDCTIALIPPVSGG